ncbi:MAG: hypothetical protein KME04_14705 [Pleurocapsa minor GSE-CHR-MK-17-07R]|jgi:LuxR family maltose regulon positive regulatory protein|nr:hypothetical protein [Pleurocapsa minor GSE-CHR-MK 17-07R]
MSSQSTQSLPTILTTKLYVPPQRANVVLRPRLVERLNEGLGHRLTLVSAPAGFGKTTLVSEWVAACAQSDPKVSAAWLSLDEADHDLTRFLMHLIAALQTVAPTIGAGLLPLLHAPQLPPTESLLTALLNDIAIVSGRFMLVLDDYHLTDARPIDEALAFLVEHLPPHLHVIMTTREDPDIPLARLRARAQLTEIRAKDLRFTSTEAAEFLNQVMGLNLPAEALSALEDRTEGWIAGLQLAALSLEGHQDTQGFIRAFAGDHRYIVDYLVAEVLERQPRPVRQFLLQTAVLDRFNASLCDAVTGQRDGIAQLEALERGNFFIVPLDDKRHWYRYHRLFADVLSAHLKAEQADQVAVLHQRASAWYEQHDLPADAIRHALMGEDFQRAATLIERAVPATRRSRQESALLGWLRALPDDILHFRPALNVQYAGTLLISGVMDGVEARLSDAERWLEMLAASDQYPAEALSGLVVVDEQEFRRVPGAVAMYRAAIGLLQGNVNDTLKYAGKIPELAGEEDDLLRGSGAGLLALAHWTRGELESARQAYKECITRLERIGHISDALGCHIALADIQMAQGQVLDARNTYERGWQLATRGGSVLRGASDMLVGLSQLDYERDDLKAATQHLLHTQELGELAGLPQNRYRWRAAMARIRHAEGDLLGALDLLHEAEQVFTRDFSPNVQPVHALKARLWIAQGKLDDALGWAREQGLSVDDPLSYLREFEHITLARIRLAQSKRVRADQLISETIEFLERLLLAAEAGGRTGSVIEILVLHALAWQLQGNISAALSPLKRALTLAEPEHYVRTFVDEGAPMMRLLEEAAKGGVAPGYVHQLLRSAGKAVEGPPVQHGLTDRLSEREIDVLRLLATDLSGPEIARELIVSLNTLRTHTRNIFAKLGANNRRTAIRRAEELDLL